MRGRKPHPTALKLFRGNPGRRPLNDREPQHEPLDPAVPEALTTPIARAEWERVIGALTRGQVTTVDRAVLMGYCQKYGQWQALEAEAAQHPYLVRGVSGAPLPNPALKMADRAFKLMLTAAVELGITPSSRSRIVLTPSAEPAGADEFTAFQRRRRGR